MADIEKAATATMTMYSCTCGHHVDGTNADEEGGGGGGGSTSASSANPSDGDAENKITMDASFVQIPYSMIAAADVEQEEEDRRNNTTTQGRRVNVRSSREISHPRSTERIKLREHLERLQQAIESPDKPPALCYACIQR
jgi:hypothetical protein